MRLLAVALLVVVACSETSGSTTTIESVTCGPPPQTAVEATSDIEITVEPNPVRPLQEVELSVSGVGFPEDTAGGVDAGWQCWDGSSWVTTHVVYRGFAGHAGQTIPVNREFQIQVRSIGLALDEGYPIVIPDVAPGLYRIEDGLALDDGRRTGFVIVEVIG